MLVIGRGIEGFDVFQQALDGCHMRRNELIQRVLVFLIQRFLNDRAVLLFVEPFVVRVEWADRRVDLVIVFLVAFFDCQIFVVAAAFGISLVNLADDAPRRAHDR